MANPRPTMVPQAAVNTVGLVQNPAYKTNNINDYGPYDTLPFVANQAEYGFFTQGIGSNGKTRFDTNMVTGSQFPLGRNVVMQGLGFHLLFSGGAATTRAAQVLAFYDLFEESVVDFVIQGRQFEVQFSGSMWLPEVALVNSETSAEANVSFQRVGDYFRQGGLMLTIPVTLQNLVPFQLNWYVNLQSAKVQAALAILIPQGSTPAKMRWHLKGTLEQAT